MKRPPPSFADARTRRERARAAGLSPDHWYPVEYERALGRGQVLSVRFWDAPIALYRDAGGAVHALEDRCAHRHLALSLGTVTDGCLTCAYHGWSYGADGTLARVPHDLFGHSMPSARVRAYPVRARYGLVWLFPGDPALADATPLPHLPEREGPDPWAYVPLGFTWRAHHSMVMENLCDLSHAHLHRGHYSSFRPGRLLGAEADEDRVTLRYEALVGPLYRRPGVAPTPLTVCYDYPYHRAALEWSGMTGRISYWTFLLPIDRATTRVFFVFSYDRLRVPGLPFSIGHRLMTWFLRLADRPIRRLLGEDGFALEAEQAGWEAHWDAAVVELNPAVVALQDLTIDKWQAQVARAGQRPEPAAVTT